MKKIIFVFSCLAMATVVNSQTTWNQTLNTVAGNPFLGTINPKPINFFTNNVMRMTLNSTGELVINNLAGSGDRFLQADGSGQLKFWEGSSSNNTKILFGDNTWKPYPFTTSGNNTSMLTGTRFGIGASSPVTELDVNGGLQVANGMRVGESVFIGSATNYGLMTYIPGTGGQPSILAIGAGGTAHPRNPNPGSAYNPFGNGHGGITTDPQPSGSCVNGSIGAILSTNDMITVQHLNGSTNVGNINIGHNGTNAFIETQGTNPSYPNAGDLYINSFCNRSMYVFGNGSAFGTGNTHIMSVAGQMNVTQNVQIGGGTALSGFQYGTAALYINAPPTSAATGLRVYHGGGSEAGIKIIEKGTSIRAFAINNGSSNLVDGPEMFSIYGDGHTNLTSSNSNALSIYNGIVSGASGPLSFNVSSNGYTEIKTSNTKALSIYDASNSNNETFQISKNGYTEIKVYSTSNMPTPYSLSPRAFTIRDVTNNKDIFAVNANGTAYSRALEITLTPNFPDYVFKKDYKLMSISEVGEYIATCGHLPGFENGEFYEKNGLNVSDMFVKQQEKIEELMLYILELEKRLKVIEKK